MSHVAWLASATLAVQLATSASAQCPQFTASFDGGGFDGLPLDMLAFDDGSGDRLFVGGSFRVAGAVSASNVAAWDGTRWSSVGSGTNAAVRSLAAFDDGTGPALYAGGTFTLAGALPADHVARWNGSAWSDLAGGLDGTVDDLAAFDDGTGPALYAGGMFTHAGGAPASYVARWNGSVWSAVGAGLPNRVRALAVHDAGSGPALYAAGAFPDKVARWNGTSWVGIGGALAISTGAEILALASYDAGPGARWLIAGGRGMLGSSTGVARWDGAGWSALLSFAQGKVEALEVHQDPGGLALYAAGGPGVDWLARWTPASGWSDFGPFGPTYFTLAIGFYDNGSGAGEQMFVGGHFTWVGFGSNAFEAQRIARFDGVSWHRVQDGSHSFWPAGSYPDVRALASWRDPADGHVKLLAGGHSSGTSDDPAAVGLAVWDGTTWSRFPGNAYVGGYALIGWVDPVTSRDVLVATGVYVPGQPIGHGTAKFDGTTWSYLGNDGPTTPGVLAAFQEPGSPYTALFAGGSFVTPTLGLNHVARWDGASWTPLGSGLDSECRALVVFDPPGPAGPGLYAGGSFSQAGGVPVDNVARWDGVQWSSVGSALGPVDALAVFDDGAGPNLFAGTRLALGRYDGSSWTLYPYPGSLVSAADALEVFDDGTGPALYMAAGLRFRNGQFESYDAISVWPDAMLAFEDELGRSKALWFAGPFESAGGIPSRGVARWSDPCAALTSYCTAKTNSQGCVPAIAWNGEPSVSASATTPFEVTAAQVINQKSGILFYGTVGRAAAPFQGGTLCVQSPVRRTPVRNSGGNTGGDDCSGLLAIDLTPWIAGANDPALEIGVLVDGQWWYRDPAIASATGLSDAIEFEIRP